MFGRRAEMMMMIVIVPVGEVAFLVRGGMPLGVAGIVVRGRFLVEGDADR